MALRGIKGWLLFIVILMFIQSLVLIFSHKLIQEGTNYINVLMGVLFLVSVFLLIIKHKYAINLSKVSFLIPFIISIISNIFYLIKFGVVSISNLLVTFSFYLIFTSYFNYSERVRKTYNLKKGKVGFPEIIFVNLNNKKDQFFKDWVYLFASFFFSIVGGIYNFSKFRKERLGFAIVCLILGIIGFLLAILGTSL